jgi:multidrug efflux pump
MPTPGGNPIQIAKQIRALEPEIRHGMPPGMQMNVAYDTSKFIVAAIHEVITTLALAVCIVIVVIFLFLGTIRSVVIPVVTIPLSLIGAGILMLALGFSLNLLTLLAMVLAIGLVVDDAIVVVENVYRHVEEGHTPLEAALLGAREIVGPVIAMTITLAAVYAPIGFLGGLTGALFREFAFTLAGAVIISGVIALTLSPMMASKLLIAHMHERGFAKVVDGVFARVTAWYSRRLVRALDQPVAMAVFIVGVFLSVGFLYLNTRAELAPAEDQGVMLAMLKAPQTANLDYTNSYALKLGGIFRKYPEVEASFTLSGQQAPNQAFAAMQLRPWGERSRSAMTLMRSVQAELSKLDGVNGFAFTLPPLPGSFGTLPVSFVISTPDDYHVVFDNMEKLKTAARNSGRFLVVDSDLTYNSPVIRLNIDRAKAHDLGIQMQAIGDTLATLVGENYINRFNLEGRAYEVITQVPRSLRLTADALTQFYVRTSSGQQIPLSTVVSVSNAVEPNALSRYNQLNSATFNAVPMPGVSMGEAVEFLRQEAEKLPSSFNTAFLSDSRQYVQEGNQLLYTFVFALIVIYLVLAAQFESLRDPLVIMVSVPMSVCGALLPLFIGLSTMNIYTQVGLVTLIGLITKHGILMVSFARNHQIHESSDRRTAIIEAARVRLRPILMTTAAMIAGLLPLLFATGAGASARFAIGLVVVAGMAIGTMFTLFVLPAVYVWIASDHRVVSGAAGLQQAVPAE